MFKQFSTRLAMVSVFLLSSSLGVAHLQAAEVSARAELLSLTTTGASISLTENFFVQHAETDLSSAIDHDGSTPMDINLSGSSSAISRVAIDANDVLPYTEAKVNNNEGEADATALWQFEFNALSKGTVVFDFEYAYAAKILNLLSGEAGAVSTLIARVEGSENEEFQEYRFINENNQIEGIEKLLLTLDVDVGDSGIISFEAMSSAYVRPVPVPAAIWLFGTALAGMIGLRRRNA